ncbi:MAG TPA: site-2 protease family protein [Gaiellaceae bacterium]|nr:site-2 protease family protein [Gaiellaceae bacterium]
MSVLVAVLGLGALVFVHELGHFLASLALRMRPRRFYVGFPPALVRVQRGGIEYGIGAIPLGGFVKIPGMHRPAASDVDAQLGRLVGEAPDLAGAVDRVRRLLAASDDAGALEAVRLLREGVARRELSELTRRSTEKGLGDLEDALGPDAYWRAATWRRVLVIAAGPLANVALAVVLLVVFFASAGGKATTRVDQVTPDSPAASAGLQAGDRILAVGGTPVTDATRIPRLIGASRGRPLTLVVQRDGRRVVLGPVAPRLLDGAYRLGFVLRGTGMPVGEATGSAFRATWQVTREIVASLGRLVTGSGARDISSPVGIVQGSSEAAKSGAESYMAVLALISLSIALLNLLPLLPLDGGHIAFAVAEGIRGRAVAREIYERVSVVGIALVVLLFVIGLSNDIGRLS